jgi:hypothetical protein
LPRPIARSVDETVAAGARRRAERLAACERDRVAGRLDRDSDGKPLVDAERDQAASQPVHLPASRVGSSGVG